MQNFSYDMSNHFGDGAMSFSFDPNSLIVIDSKNPSPYPSPHFVCIMYIL